MKKIKLLTAVSAIAALGAVTPIAMLATSCNNKPVDPTPVEPTLTKEDKEYLTKINVYAVRSNSGKTPHKAVTACRNMGEAIFEHKFSNSAFELVYNADAENFAVLSGEKILTSNGNEINVAKENIWKFTSKYEPEIKYAQYLKDDYVFDETTTLLVKTSLDVGNNTYVKKIKVTNPDASTTSVTHLRTFCEHLEISDTKGEINHYNSANNISIVGVRNGDVNQTHYVEWGKSAYVKAQDTQISYGSDEQLGTCSIDTLEIEGTNVELKEDETKKWKGGTVYVLINGQTTPETTPVRTTTTKTVATAQELMNINESCVVKLTSSISFTGNTTWTIADKTIILDLNGNNISDNTTSQAGKQEFEPLIKVNGDGALILMDSAGISSTATITLTHPITVEGTNNAEGTEPKMARMLMNGANIIYTANANNMRAAIIVGKTQGNALTTEGKQISYPSEFYMYGGSINSKNNSTESAANAPAIKPSGLGSYTYIAYGNVVGQNGAIVTDDGSANYNSDQPYTDGAEIEIVGGTFSTSLQPSVSTERQICISLRRRSKLTIYGGYFYGASCIGAVNSDVTINGGVFSAFGKDTGTFIHNRGNEGNPHVNYLVADGSVIEFYWQGDDKTQAGQSYGGASDEGKYAAPSLRVNNAKMISYYGNIFRIGHNAEIESHVPEETKKTYLEFINGDYYYNDTAVVPQYVGMKFQDQKEYDNTLFGGIAHGGLWTRINIPK